MTQDNNATRMAYIEAARANYGDEGRIEIDDNAKLSRGSDSGAYVQAWVWVDDADLEPEPGPSYDVWLIEPDDNGTYQDMNWGFTQRFTCEDDPDGIGARRSAHEYARYLRKTFPCAYVAVRPAGKAPDLNPQSSRP